MDQPNGNGKSGPKKSKRSLSEEGGPKKKIKKENTSKISSPDDGSAGNGAIHPITHRPVTSCTHCRQHKIKCDASQNFPAPCTRCEKNGFHCEINPQFRPKKGSMMQMLAHEVDDLKYKVSYLIRNEGIVARALSQYHEGREIMDILSHNPPGYYQEGKNPNHHNKNSSTNSHSSPASNTTGTPNHDHHFSSPNNAKISVQTYLAGEHPLVRQNTNSPILSVPNSVGAAPISGTRNSLVNGKYTNSVNKPILPPILNDSTPTNNAGKSQLNSSLLQMTFHKGTPLASSPSVSRARSPSLQQSTTPHSIIENDYGLQQVGQISAKRSPIVATTTTMDPLPSPHANIDEFVLGDIRLPITKADELHETFVTKYLPYFPILTSSSATELYGQSQLLFWTVILTASLSDPEPTLYTQLASLIKQLAIETCWIRTPRSTHISQALLILCIWPLPNQKVLDDCSYRFVGLARTLSYQLGLHRGEFIYEFTRTQTSMPDAEKWRTRTWLGIFFADLCWSSILGLPPTSQPDYLTEKAKVAVTVEDELISNKNGGNRNHDNTYSMKESAQNINNSNTSGHDRSIDLPSRFKSLILLADFQCKLCKIMGSSVTTPDGMMEPAYRADALAILEKELEELDMRNEFHTDDVINIYYLYVKLTIYCFAFLPGTPIQDQLKYVNDAYVAATKIVTLLTKLLKHQQLVELPIYIRQSATYAALILFKLQLSPALSDKCFESARQSIVTVHRLYRNQLSAWATAVENDISRTASMLEKLNFVLITHPEVLVEEEGIISRMRSHLTGSLFYDLVWCVHEARRREVDLEYNKQALASAKAKRKERGGDSPGNILESKLYPLPLYNQISKEDFKTVTKTTPNGTTVTTLVPTRSALQQAENNRSGNGNAVSINGIPLAMLDENGSLDTDNLLGLQNMAVGSNTNTNGQNGNGYPRMIDSIIRSESNGIERPSSAMATIGTNDQTTSNLEASILPRPSKDDLNTYSNDLSMERQTSFPPTQHPRTAASSIMSVPEIPKNGKSFKDLAGFQNWNPIAGNSNANNPDGKQKSEELLPTNSRLQLNQLSDFFQQQSAGWIEGNLGNDDFFGWLDMNMEPKF
ncbi:putative transcription factor SEF1 [Nakaseomyces bracarensis]|uniref:Transcription factor SEF1 n=1 Tax=Nakaseomyces bracarensis TaxID=273131 RepID=A0ABR4NNA2_9SACH